jgi:signal transduction histidine kinase
VDISLLFQGDPHYIFRHDLDLPEDVVIYGDPEQFKRMLINLIKNAIQSIPDDRAGLVELKARLHDEKLMLEILDNGRGIPEELKEKMFQPNFTTKSSGMGLGLAIVKQITESMGAEIRYESKLDQGTSFFVTIPFRIQS